MTAKTTANLGKTAMSGNDLTFRSYDAPPHGKLRVALSRFIPATTRTPDMLATADTLVVQPLSSRESSALAPYETASDFALIDAISNGDRRAMLLLYRRHSTNVYRFAFRLVGDDGTAEEVVSEVFVQVWRNASSFEGRSKVLTWMLAIARQRALRAMRRRSPVGPFGIAAR